MVAPLSSWICRIGIDILYPAYQGAEGYSKIRNASSAALASRGQCSVTCCWFHGPSILGCGGVVDFIGQKGPGFWLYALPSRAMLDHFVD